MSPEQQLYSLSSVFLLKFVCADCATPCSSHPSSLAWPWTWIWPFGTSFRCGFDLGPGLEFCAMAPRVEPGTLLPTDRPLPLLLVFGLGPPKGTRVHLLDVPLVSQLPPAKHYPRWLCDVCCHRACCKCLLGRSLGPFCAMACSTLGSCGMLSSAPRLVVPASSFVRPEGRLPASHCSLLSCLGAPAKALLPIGAIGAPCLSALHWEAPSPPPVGSRRFRSTTVVCLGSRVSFCSPWLCQPALLCTSCPVCCLGGLGLGFRVHSGN